MAILWNKKFDSAINVIHTGTDWCAALQYTHNNEEFIVSTVYTPYECQQDEDEYLNRLAFINSFIQDQTSSYVYVVGDMNANISDVLFLC